MQALLARITAASSAKGVVRMNLAACGILSGKFALLANGGRTEEDPIDHPETIED